MSKTLFPIKIIYSDNDEIIIVDAPEHINQNRLFRVLETNVYEDEDDTETE